MSATGARRNENVGAPTWIRNVVVYIGAGTTRRAAVANGAEMIGDSGESLQFTADSLQFGARLSSRLEPPGIRRWW